MSRTEPKHTDSVAKDRENGIDDATESARDDAVRTGLERSVEPRPEDTADRALQTPLRVQADWSGTETLDAAVTTAISRATDADVTDLAPLYEYMDPDALHAFVASLRDRETRTSITFSYEGHDVSVRDDGEILVWPARSGRDDRE